MTHVLLPNTVALVTGANRGIGRALVHALLSRGIGKVYAAARRIESLPRFNDDRVVPLVLDVTKPDTIRAATAFAADVTLLVNNAGVAGHMGQTLAEPQWIEAGRQEFEVNVLGTLAVTQAFAPALAANGGGAIVNIASVASLVAFPALTTYSASKAAVHSLTQATRAHLRAQGTRVIGVYPGPVDTEMAERLPMEKTPPAAAAAAILDGIEAGDEEVFPDAVSRQLAAVYASSPKTLELQANPRS